MEWIFFVFWLLVLIGPLIFAHEAGHFLFAKLFNVKVLVFSLGFGGPVRLGSWKLSKKINDTEYRVAWVPLGGFVRMLGDDPTEEVPAEEQDRSFSRKPPWKRFFIVLGGPLFSILFAIPIFFVFHLMLPEAPAPVIGRVIASTAADQAGLRYGDHISKIDGTLVDTWDEIDTAIQHSEGKPIVLSVVRGEIEMEVRVVPVKVSDQSGIDLYQQWDIGIRHSPQGNTIGVVSTGSPAGRSGLKSWDRVLSVGGIPVKGWWELETVLRENGRHWLPVTAVRQDLSNQGDSSDSAPQLIETMIVPEDEATAPQDVRTVGSAYTGIEPIDLYIEGITKGYPAEKHGIQPGDKIVRIAGKAIDSWDDFSRYLEEGEDKVIEIAIRREEQLHRIEFVPKTIVQTNEFRQKTQKPGFGVQYRSNITSGKFVTRPDRLANAFRMAFVETGQAITRQIEGMAAIFKGKIKPTEAIGGPLMIADLARKSAERGWRQFVAMMAFLSVFLGLLNLLPIPILDGGHIVFIMIEGITRTPVSMKVRLIANYVGLFLLVSLMLFAFTNDVHRYWFQ